MVENTKVLMIGAVWPEPKSSAGGARFMQLIHLFQSWGCEITFASSAQTSGFEENLEEIKIKTQKIELNSSSFDEFIQQLQPVIVVFDRFMTEEQFGWRVAENCPNAIRIIETIDLHCLRMARQEALKVGGDWKVIIWESETTKRELAAYYRSDLNLIISDAEFQILTEEFNFPKNQLFYLPFQIHSNQITLESFPSFEERANFVSIGNFKHPPNWDAVKYLKQEIFPKIRALLPTAELKIYGSYADAKVLQLHQPKEGFYIMGRAEDAGEVMKKARVCLAPLRFGAGIKGKLLESMMFGTPNVTTEIGAEGMKGSHNWNGYITESADDFARKGVELYQDKIKWLEFQKNGITILKEHFSAETEGKELQQKLNDLAKNLKTHRRNNLVGSMLMHHTLQSTKYLSKWIEAKNSDKR